MNILLIQCLKRSKTKSIGCKRWLVEVRRKELRGVSSPSPLNLWKIGMFFLNNHRTKQNDWLFGIPKMGVFARMILYIDLCAPCWYRIKRSKISNVHLLLKITYDWCEEAKRKKYISPFRRRRMYTVLPSCVVRLSVCL